MDPQEANTSSILSSHSVDTQQDQHEKSSQQSESVKSVQSAKAVPTRSEKSISFAVLPEVKTYHSEMQTATAKTAEAETEKPLEPVEGSSTKSNLSTITEELEGKSSRKLTSKCSKLISELSHFTWLSDVELKHMTDEQFLKYMSHMELRNKRLKMENKVMKHYLKRNDPRQLAELEARMTNDSSYNLVDDKASKDDTEDDTAENSIPMISVSFKQDMVLKYVEDLQVDLDDFMKENHKEKRECKAKLEEMSIREEEIAVMREQFDALMTSHASNRCIQKLSAEKFVKFMGDTLKHLAHGIEKMRLRTASLKVQYKKIGVTLSRRQELGANVHPVDFDQLEIENKHFLIKLDQQLLQLIEIKKMNGQANLILSKFKKLLSKQQKDSKKLKEQIAENIKAIDELDKECSIAREEVDKAQAQYQKLQEFRASYQVPDVMEYVKIKNQLDSHLKDIKVWTRRNKILDISLNSSIRQMKNVTGKPFSPKWLQDVIQKRQSIWGEDMWTEFKEKIIDEIGILPGHVGQHFPGSGGIGLAQGV